MSSSESLLRAPLAPFTAVIITGGSSGIGKSFIELGSTLKPELVFCNLSRRKPDKISGKFLNHFPCDLGDAGAIEPVACQVRDFLAREVPKGEILLINNSGFGAYGDFPEPNLEKNLAMVDLNVRAVVHLTGLMLPILRERGGAVVNVASTAAFQPTPHMGTYGATKAFVLHWTHALNEELRGTRVRALALCPGPTATPFFRAAGLSPGNQAESTGMAPEDVVRAMLRGLGAGRPQVVPGWRNKLIAFVNSPLSKGLITRLAGRGIARHRLRHTGT